MLPFKCCFCRCCASVKKCLFLLALCHLKLCQQADLLNVFVPLINVSAIPNVHIFSTILTLGQQFERIWDLDQKWIALDKLV